MHIILTAIFLLEIYKQYSQKGIRKMMKKAKEYSSFKAPKWDLRIDHSDFDAIHTL